MILTSTASAPRYSTDSTASEISRFVAARETLRASTPRPSATEAPRTLEELYPSLFAEAQPSTLDRIFGAVAAFVDRTGALLGRSRSQRHAERASRVSHAIASRYIPKA